MAVRAKLRDAVSVRACFCAATHGDMSLASCRQLSCSGMSLAASHQLSCIGFGGANNASPGAIVVVRLYAATSRDCAHCGFVSLGEAAEA